MPDGWVSQRRSRLDVLLALLAEIRINCQATSWYNE